MKALASEATESGFADPQTSVAAMRVVTALHADARALSSEWPGGPASGAAARNLMMASAAAIAEVQAFAAGPDEQRSSEAWMRRRSHARPVRHKLIHRSTEAGWRNGLRAAPAVVLAAVPFVLGG